MKYIKQLSHNQVLEIMEIYAPNHSNIKIYDLETSLKIFLLDEEGNEDAYIFTDYNVEIYDWSSYRENEYLIKFREKMLEWFGNQYAVDWLLKTNC